MTMKLLSADDFRAAAREGGQPDGTVFRFAAAEPQSVDGATRTKRFVFSDATIDHAGDSIDPKGWDLAIFNRNPVALFSHMAWEPPIGRASNVGVQGKQLVGDIEFATADVYEFADTIYRLVDGGFLKAVSVGFKPDQWAFTNDKDRPYGIDFKQQTLLEISVCAVPCNPNALGEARSIGIDTAPLIDWAEKVLDTGDTVFLPKSEIETLRAQAGTVQKRFYIQATKSVRAEVAQNAADAVKAWQDSPGGVLVMPPGLELRTIGEQSAAPDAIADETEDEDLAKTIIADVEAAVAADPDLAGVDVGKFAAVIGKAGRRVSAATKAKLQEAMGHQDSAMASHAETAKCIKALLDDPDAEPDDDPDDDGTGDPDAQPPGSVVIESDENLTPEELRLKEARALKASLPTGD